MNILARVTPVKCHKIYNGTGTNGDYIIGSWIFKNVDGTEFTAECFTENHNYLLANPTLQIDVSIDITGKPYKETFYNKLAIKNIIKPEGVQDLPDTLPPVSSGIDPTGGLGGSGVNGSDLPF